MLNRPYIQFSPDVNQGASSTPTPDATTVSASSTETTPSTPPASGGLESALADAYKKAVPQQQEEVSEETPPEETPVVENKEEIPQETVSPEEKQEVEKEVDPKNPIPYERFQEVNTAKVQLESQVAELTPKAEAYIGIENFCQSNNVSPEKYAFWVSVAAMAENNPPKALEMLKPVFQNLQGHVGESLPPDLQKAIEEGKIDPEYAKELAKARAQTTFKDQEVQRAKASALQQQHQASLVQIQQSLTSWESQKKTSDPEFQPRKDPTAPMGKYEVFLKVFEAEVKGAKSIQDIISTADKVYKDISTTFSKSSVRPKPTTNVRSSQASTSTTVKPKSLEEALKQRAGVLLNSH